jgi:hypothetical protein
MTDSSSESNWEENTLKCLVLEDEVTWKIRVVTHDIGPDNLMYGHKTRSPTTGILHHETGNQYLSYAASSIL